MKPVEGVLQGDGGAPGPKRKPRQLSDTPLDQLARSVFLTVPEAAAFLRFPSVKAFHEWARRRAIPRCRRGRVLLFYRKDLEAAVRPDYLKPTKHRGAS